MDEKELEALELAARIVMENGGETYRVEETVDRMGRAFQMERVESFAVPSGVFLSFLRRDGISEAAVVRVRHVSTNLTRVDEVNQISRDVENGKLDAPQAVERLKELQLRRPLVDKSGLVVAACVAASAFALMFGGDWTDAVIAFVVGGLVQLMALLPVDALMMALVGAFVTSLLPELLYLFTGIGHTQPVVAGALMALLPGLKMTTAIRDTLRGDVVSGVSNAATALLIAALVAAGVLASAGLTTLIGGAL